MQKRTKAFIRFALLSCRLAMPEPSASAELKPEALKGFDRYVQLSEQRMQNELGRDGNFIRVSDLPEPRRSETYARLERGEVVSERLETRDAAGLIHTPGALIHHWAGTVFIPGASLRQVLTVVQDYDREQESYSPEVVKSKLLAHNGDDFRIYLRLRQTEIITVVLDTEHEVHYTYLGPTRALSRSLSTRVAEIENPGKADERSLPPGQDNGFLWRLNSYWSFEETGQGVYVQCEAISLTRDIPLGLDWLIRPFLERIPRESLEFTLRSARNAVLSSVGHVATPQPAAR